MKIRDRVGSFKVSLDLIDKNPSIVMQAMSRCIIVRAEHLYAYNCIEYVAISPEFDIVPAGTMATEYRVEITRDDAGVHSIMFVPAK